MVQKFDHLVDYFSKYEPILKSVIEINDVLKKSRINSRSEVVLLIEAIIAIFGFTFSGDRVHGDEVTVAAICRAGARGDRRRGEKQARSCEIDSV